MNYTMMHGSTNIKTDRRTNKQTCFVKWRTVCNSDCH